MTLAADPIGSAGGTHLANYTYDEGEQRIAKASGSDLIHYHYDDEGRLIAESDGHTGATLRDYIWLGLTPIAVIATEEVTNETGPCDEELITALEAELAAANSAADVIEAEIADQQATAQFRQDKVDEMYAQLDTVSGNRRDALERRIERWEDKIATLDSQIELLTLDLADIYNQIGQIETALTEARNNCDGGGGPTLEAGTYYLHADHLGKPQFATDSTGATVWDGGITTPFGEGVALAGAFAQNLMFPGQYADLETAANDNTPLFHNWHRTYDPTLGRYLQSDPIGLAGGINRYAYVGGNPVSYIDPRGEFIWGIAFAGLDLAWQLYKNNGRLDCINWWSIGLNAIGGKLFQTAFKRGRNTKFSHWIPDRFVRKGSKYYKPNVDKYLGRFVNSRFNGNYVSPRTHALTDPFRRNFFPSAWKNRNLPYNPKIQQLLRIPGWVPGIGAVGAAAASDNCECK